MKNSFILATSSKNHHQWNKPYAEERDRERGRKRRHYKSYDFSPGLVTLLLLLSLFALAGFLSALPLPFIFPNNWTSDDWNCRIGMRENSLLRRLFCFFPSPCPQTFHYHTIPAAAFLQRNSIHSETIPNPWLSLRHDVILVARGHCNVIWPRKLEGPSQWNY